MKVFASHAQDASGACLGAEDAIEFFRAGGLKTDISIEIHVQDFLPPEAGASAAGCYIQRDGKILMRTYAKFREHQDWFNVPIDRRMYRSLAAHETAHALAAGNFTIPAPGVRATEYIAYVVMFASMEPALRARILAAFPGPGFRSADRLTELMYMFDPMRFGVESYRHYVHLENGPLYLREVFVGRALGG